MKRKYSEIVNNRKYEFKLKKRKCKKRGCEEDINDDEDYDDGEYDNYHYFFSFNGNITCINNNIYFRGKVTEASVERLIQLINKKNNEFNDLNNNTIIKTIVPNPIYLFITSYGGCFFSGLRAVDAIKNSRIPIYTVVDGHVASAGTLMSIVGERRYITPHSYMLIHQLSSSTIGKYWEIKDDYKNSKQFMEMIYKIYTEHTKMNRDELKKILKHDRWWDAETCIEKGLVDEIYGGMNN